MHGHTFTTGGPGPAAVWAVGATLVGGVGLVLALAVLVATVVPVATQGCDELDASGEPVAPAVGSVGGVGGSGISRAGLSTVRASSLAGSAFTTGDFHATAYGPPWGGIQGPGVATAGGIRIDGGAPRKYFIATDPDVISLGQWVYVQPNPFGWQGAFLAADTGGRIKGRRIDFYDWRGRAHQNRWNQQVKVSDRPFPAQSGEGDAIPVESTVNAAAAREVAREITGQPVGFALVDRDGQVLASVAPNATNRSASITKATILVALTHEARSRDLTSAERQQVAAMIRRSDNQAANALFARIGPVAVDTVAGRAGMTSFTLVRRRQGTDGFVLGFSRVSAVDQARLFARIDELVAPPPRLRAGGA